MWLLAALLGGQLAACGEAPPAPARSDAAPAAVSASSSLEQPAAALPGVAPAEPQAGDGASLRPDGVMTGTWSGGWHFAGRAVEGEARVALRHFDETFNGYIELTPDVGAVCGKTSGTIVYGHQVDDYVTFGFYDIYSHGFTFHGTLRGETLSGELVAITECGAESGSFRFRL